MVDDNIAAEEIARQIAALKPRVEGPRGVMGYLDKAKGEQRADVNKMFLASTIRGVNSHNRRQEEDKCWTLRRMERKLDESTDRRKAKRSRSRDRKPTRRRSSSRSRSRSHSRNLKRRRHRSRSRSDEGMRRSRSRERKALAEKRSEKDDDERSYWAKKKADKTRKLWENLHLEGSVSVENAPDFSSDESDDDDVKPPSSEKKHKKNKKHKTSHKKSKRRSHS